MVHLWKTCILDQSCAVLGGMITAKNKKDLERTQQNFAKFVLQGKYTTYNSALISSGHDSLEEGRKKLTLTFVKTSKPMAILRKDQELDHKQDTKTFTK